MRGDVGEEKPFLLSKWTTAKRRASVFGGDGVERLLFRSLYLD